MAQSQGRRLSLPTTSTSDYALRYFQEQSVSILSPARKTRRHSCAAAQVESSQFLAVAKRQQLHRIRSESECRPRINAVASHLDLVNVHKSRLDYSEKLLTGQQSYDYINQIIQSSTQQLHMDTLALGNSWPFDRKLELFVKKHKASPLRSATLAIINHHQKRAVVAGEPRLFNSKDFSKLASFLTRVEVSYQTTSYHNALHAVDVVGATEVLMNQLEASKSVKFSLIQRVSTLLAAACHDAGHPGVTSQHIFQFYKPKRIQRLFFDAGVSENRGHAGMLERYHLSLSFQYLKESGLSQLLTDASFIDNFQKCILGTDMTKHNHAVDVLVRLNRDGARPGAQLALFNAEILPIVVHLADLSNPAKDFFDCLAWANRVVDEFYEQGDVEKMYGHEAVAPVFDRNSSKLEDIQVGFIKGIVSPLFGEWCRYVQDSTLMGIITRNLNIYKYGNTKHLLF